MLTYKVSRDCILALQGRIASIKQFVIVGPTSSTGGGFRPGWQGSGTLSAFSNLTNYRVWDLKKRKLIDFGGLEPCHRFDDRLPKHNW